MLSIMSALNSSFLPMTRHLTLFFIDFLTQSFKYFLNIFIRVLTSSVDLFQFSVENAYTVKYFTPNKETHKAFAEVLVKAESKGVKIMAYDCVVTEKELKINNPVEIKLNK